MRRRSRRRGVRAAPLHPSGGRRERKEKMNGLPRERRRGGEFGRVTESPDGKIIPMRRNSRPDGTPGRESRLGALIWRYNEIQKSGCRLRNGLYGWRDAPIFSMGCRLVLTWTRG